jgi:hypothetical protein
MLTKTRSSHLAVDLPFGRKEVEGCQGDGLGVVGARGMSTKMKLFQAWMKGQQEYRRDSRRRQRQGNGSQRSSPITTVDLRRLFDHKRIFSK